MTAPAPIMPRPRRAPTVDDLDRRAAANDQLATALVARAEARRLLTRCQDALAEAQRAFNAADLAVTKCRAALDEALVGAAR